MRVMKPTKNIAVAGCVSLTSWLAGVIAFGLAALLYRSLAEMGDEKHGDSAQAEADGDRNRRPALQRRRQQFGSRDRRDHACRKVLDIRANARTGRPEGSDYRADEGDARRDERESQSACQRVRHC